MDRVSSRCTSLALQQEDPRKGVPPGFHTSVARELVGYSKEGQPFPRGELGLKPGHRDQSQDGVFLAHLIIVPENYNKERMRTDQVSPRPPRKLSCTFLVGKQLNSST